MPSIKVTVLRDGNPVSGHRVVLSVSGIAWSMHNPEFTDSDRVAWFDVEDGQEGDVYVDSSVEGHWGSYSATDITVNL